MKPSSIVKTHCDADNQMFLATHSDFLRGTFIAAFFICKQKQQYLFWRNYTKSALRTAAQASQYTIDYASGVN